MKKKKKILIGTVVSKKMNKTVIVIVNIFFKHSIYKKIIKRNKKYYVHDFKEIFNIGDKIKFIESKPISKIKKWIAIYNI